MSAYIVRRLLLFLPTLWLVSVIIFAIMRLLPGDVASIIVYDEENPSISATQLEQVRAELGLSDPLLVQYGRWTVSLVNGEFGGRSLWNKEPIGDILKRRMPKTLLLTAYTMVIAWAISIPLGMLAAVYQNRWADYVIRVVSIGGQSLPNFWIALMAILGLLLLFAWTPPIFYADPWEDPWQHMRKMVLPALILAWGFSASLIRLTRSSMLEVLRQDYIRTARSKGLQKRVIFVQHALRNALLPILTLGGLQFGALLSGTVIVETIFGVPGMGQGIVDAAVDRDYPVIQTLAVFLVVSILFLNLVVDIVYAIVDPRIRYS